MDAITLQARQDAVATATMRVASFMRQARSFKARGMDKYVAGEVKLARRANAELRAAVARLRELEAPAAAEAEAPAFTFAPDAPTFRCRFCQRTARVSNEGLADLRADYPGETVTAADAANTFDICLGCAWGTVVPGEIVKA